MKSAFRNFIFLFLFFLCGTSVNAQKVFIANDFGNCGVGLRDSSGKWLAEPIYQSIEFSSNGYYKVLLGSKEGVLDSTGAVIIPAAYDYLHPETVYRDSVSDDIFFTVNNDGKSGLLNSKNKIIIPLRYKFISVNYDGTIIACRSKTRYSLFDIYGRETIIPGRQPKAPEAMGGGLIRVARNSCWPAFDEKYHQNRRYSWRGFYYPVLTLSKRYGMMNDSLRLIIPKDFKGIDYKPGDYKLITVTKRKKTGFYTTTGKQVWAPVYYVPYGFLHNYTVSYGSISSINRYGFTAAEYHKKWGIIAANGDTILPFIYSYIHTNYNYGSKENKAGVWIVKKDFHEGAFDPEKREWIIKPEYAMLYSVMSYHLPGDTAAVPGDHRLTYYSSIYEQNGLRIFIAEKNGKYGMISSNGQELLPFDYDNYTYNYSIGYTFRNNSTFTFVTFPDCIPGEKYLYSKPPIVDVAPADGKFKKVIYKNGDELWINPDLLNDSVQLSLYKTQVKDYVFNPQTYDHQLHATALIITTLHPSQKFGLVPNAYSIHNPDLNYPHADDSTYDFIIDPANKYISRTISVIGKDSLHLYYSLGWNGGILRDDGFRLMRSGSYYNFSYYSIVNGKAVFRVTGIKKNKTGLMDGDGKLLIDTAWAVIGSSTGSYFWVREKKSRLYRYNSYSWNILDTATGQLLLPKKMRSNEANDFGTDAVVMDYKGGPALYNYRTKKIILSSDANEIYRIDSTGKYFAVRTCFGHIGIIDGNGYWLADTIWTALINANNLKKETRWPRYYRYDYGISDETWCVLSNDTGWVIYDGIAGTISKNAATQKFLLDNSFKSVRFDSSGTIFKTCSHCPSWVYRDSTNEKPLTGWQQKMLFDSLFMGEHFMADSNFFWYVSSCKDCRKKNPHDYYFEYAWAKNYDRESLLHYVHFNNDSCISVSRSNLTSYLYNRAYPNDLFFTAVLYPDGPHPFQLDSLFEGTAWKKLISDEVSLYFESHPNIEGNCHNPYMLPLVLKDRFILTENGIELFPPGFSENEKQLFVPIPWIKLKPYMRKDVIRKLGI